MPAVQEDGRQGEVEQDAAGEEPRRECVTFGGVEFDAEQELFGRVSASAAVAAGGAEGDPDDGSSTSGDLVYRDAFWCGLSVTE